MTTQLLEYIINKVASVDFGRKRKEYIIMASLPEPLQKLFEYVPK